VAERRFAAEPGTAGILRKTAQEQGLNIYPELLRLPDLLAPPSAGEKAHEEESRDVLEVDVDFPVPGQVFQMAIIPDVRTLLRFCLLWIGSPAIGDTL
jgi:hypothetical protein